jgi:hypothetical protein
MPGTIIMLARPGCVLIFAAAALFGLLAEFGLPMEPFDARRSSGTLESSGRGDESRKIELVGAGGVAGIESNSEGEGSSAAPVL